MGQILNIFYNMNNWKLFVVSLNHRPAFIRAAAGAGVMGLGRLTALRASG
jgi:hypothetical protein